MYDLQSQESTFLILSASFSSASGCFFSGMTLKTLLFSLKLVFVFKLLCSFTKKKTGSVFPAFCHATSHHALIMRCNVARAGYIA